MVIALKAFAFTAAFVALWVAYIGSDLIYWG